MYLDRNNPETSVQAFARRLPGETEERVIDGQTGEGYNVG